MIYNDFYKVGGDLKFQHPSYISRTSDDELYQAIKNGDFCYVLNCRQMGKSSLAVQIFYRLKAEGYACCFISLSEIGSNEVTADNWYFTLTHKIARELRIDLDIADWWKQQYLSSPFGKFSQFIEEILLTSIDRDIVIFIDEIDSISRLDFSADDFFGLVRSCYNQRAVRPQYQRLRFTFLGTATPSSLINNSNCTPFNIGTAIVLQGFKLDEAKLLAKGLEDRTDRSKEIIAEVLKWTGGQPFLTQKLCKLIAESTDIDFAQDPHIIVEEITQSSIINNWIKQDNPQHLQTIQGRIIDRKKLTKEFIIKLLWLYKEVLDGRGIRSNSSPEQIQLRLSGLVVDLDGKLKIFNRIYQEVFNSDWVIQKLSEFSIPYLDKITAWVKSNYQDKSQLLTKESLENALNSSDVKDLSSIDLQYFNASEKELTIKEFKRKGILLGGFIAVAMIAGYLSREIFHQEIYDKYASCLKEQGIAGEKIANICFRSLTTSGEKPAIVSSYDPDLTHGIEEFKKEHYLAASLSFKKAVDSDRTDPIAKIFDNNAKARLNKKTLKIAAVVPIDYYQNAALDILRGVADAQTQFNKERKNKNDRLLEIVIVNDGNKPEVAKKVSTELANDPDILAIIGHHFSGSTKAALPQYSQAKIVVVSPTSSSSSLNADVFFENINTKIFASIYANYFSSQNLANIVVVDFFDPKKSDNDEYTTALYNDFKTAIRGRGVNILNLKDSSINSIESIRSKYPQTQAILAISNGEKNSATIALAKENDKMNSKVSTDRQIQLFTTHAMGDRETLSKIKESSVAVKIVGPCQNNNSPYINVTKTNWNQEDIDWRTAYSYDSTQRIIQAIESLSNPTRQNPTREGILAQFQLARLKSTELPRDKSSGFIRLDRGSLDKNIPVCVLQIEKGKSVDLKE